MNPLNLQITFLDGETVTVSAIAADLVAFESHFDMSVASLADKVRLTHLFFLAWHVLKRTKKTELPFDEWIESVQIVTGKP